MMDQRDMEIVQAAIDGELGPEDQGRLERLLAEGQKDGLQASAAYWWPRVAASFGSGGSERFDALKAMGLRHRRNDEMRSDWEEQAGAVLARLGIDRPGN